jgi:hypothetical protein
MELFMHIQGQILNKRQNPIGGMVICRFFCRAMPWHGPTEEPANDPGILLRDLLCSSAEASAARGVKSFLPPWLKTFVRSTHFSPHSLIACDHSFNSFYSM